MGKGTRPMAICVTNNHACEETGTPLCSRLLCFGGCYGTNDWPTFLFKPPKHPQGVSRSGSHRFSSAGMRRMSASDLTFHWCLGFCATLLHLTLPHLPLGSGDRPENLKSHPWHENQTKHYNDLSSGWNVAVKREKGLDVIPQRYTLSAQHFQMRTCVVSSSSPLTSQLPPRPRVL